jgi:hypothetical protein
MSLFSGKTKSTTSGTTSPTNPKPVTDGIIDFTKLIGSLGGQDPQQYVTGPSALQNSAFGIGAGIASRYGAQPASAKPQTNGGMRSGDPDTMGGFKPSISEPQPKSTVQNSGLYNRLGVQPTASNGPEQLGPDNFTPDAGLRAGWQQVASRPQDQQFIRNSGGDYDNNGSISEAEFYNWHRSTFNDRSGYQPDALGGTPQAGGVPQTGGGMPQTGGVGYSATGSGNNPNALYGDAARIAQGVAGAGANYAQGGTLGPASMVGRTEIAPVSNASATQGYRFSQPYENRYTDQVVDTTLANFDEYAGRQRAQEAAQAAGNNAFGGSRYGVQRAITEEQIARERASQESGLRFGAQDRAFGLGMQDANSVNQMASQNAAAANAQAMAQAQLDMSRNMTNAGANNQFALTQFGADNNMSQFNAGQGDAALARRLAASGQMGDLAGAMGNNERADLAMLAQLGEQERGINQQGATADLQLMQLMAQLYGTMPYNLFNGQNSTQTGTQTTNPGVLGILGAGAMGAGSLGWSPFGG